MLKTFIKEESNIVRKRQALEEYLAAPNEENTQRVFNIYASLVKTTAVRLKVFLGDTASLDELTDNGISGLIEAIHKYERDQKLPFEAYAAARVKRAMILALGKKGPVQQKLTSTKKKIDGAREELRVSSGHYPDDIEVARKLGISLTALVEAEEAFKLSQAVSLDSFVEETMRQAKAPEAAKQSPFNQSELSGRLRTSMALLTKEEQKVVLMFYYEDLTQKEIAGVLGISEEEVATLHISAMSKMQVEMLEYMDIFINAV